VRWFHAPPHSIDFAHAPNVARLLAWLLLQERLENPNRFVGLNHSRTNAQYVCVVVLSRKPCGLLVPTGCSTDSLKLICRDCHANPSAANQNSHRSIAAKDSPRHLFGRIWVIVCALVRRTQFGDSVAALDEPIR
jgi:hypothetical protein